MMECVYPLGNFRLRRSIEKLTYMVPKILLKLETKLKHPLKVESTLVPIVLILFLKP